jgi:hypothetical protein
VTPFFGEADDAAVLWTSVAAYAGSARDYLNAPVDTWLLNYNAGYTTSVTPEDDTDTVPGVRSNVFAQSIVLTRSGATGLDATEQVVCRNRLRRV